MVILQPNIPRLLLLVFIVTFGFSVSAQESEEELSEYALELFEQEEYAAAGKTYSTLLSIRLQSAEYNYRYGACELFTAEDKEGALQYLRFACEQENPPALAHFYYGLGLHLNYQFDKAIAQYEQYKPQAGRKDREAGLVDHYIEQCRNGKELVSSFTDISVIQRTVLPRTEFYRNYDLSEFGGKIIVKPEDFMSEEDKKRDAKFLMYFQQDADLIYYASYSEKNETGKDLYVIQKLPGGDWSAAKRLDNTINTPHDEDFPFIHPEGDVLYFASKGHNSMGGYDIFKSTRKGDGSWTKPINMEFAINTPWDDFMFITDQEEKAAWFASNRETSNTEVTVYRIGIQRIPLDLTLIKGVFETEGSKKATITVEDMVQEKQVGVFVSNGATGEYLMDLKGSGQYKFIVEAEESNAVHTGIVEVPREKGLKQFRQEMNLLNNWGKEQLQIINHFDEPLEGEQLLTADILKKQASLSVNASEDDLQSNLAVLDDGGSAAGSDDGLDPIAKMQMAQKARDELSEEAAMMNKKAAALFNVAQEKYNSDDPDELAQASIASELASTYKNEANRRSTAVDQMDQLLAEMRGTENNADAYNARYTQVAAMQNNFKPADKFDERVANDLEQRLDPTITATASKQAEVKDLEDDIASIDEEIAYYKEEMERSKDDAIKAELATQIEDAQQARPVKQTALERAKKELTSLEEQKENAQKYLGLASSMLAQAASTAPGITSEVSNVALNEMQQVMQRKALGNPALMAFLSPEKAEETMEQELADRRSENNTRASDDEGPNSESNDVSDEESDNVEAATAADTDNEDQEAADLNDEIERIEAEASTPEVVRGDLESHFSAVLEEIESNEDPIIAESNKAEVYDQWAENIALKIDSLERVKANTSDYVRIQELDEDIAALRGEQEEKEALAMESYQKVAELSDAEANQLADAGSSDTNEGSMTSSEDATPIGNNSGNTEEAAPPMPAELLEEGTLPQGVVTLNEQYSDELMALEAASANASPVEYNLKRADALEDWGNDLLEEMNVLAAQIKAAPTLEQQRILEQKAATVGEMRMNKMQEATALRKESVQIQDAERNTTASKDLQAQLSPYVEVYNASAFQQIDDQIRMIPDSNQRKTQMQTLYKNWAVGIQNEKLKTEARMINTEDPNRRVEFENKLAALNQANQRVSYVLDSLETAQDLAGPSVPSAVQVKGSERFEGYTPVETEQIDLYSDQAATQDSKLEDVNDELAALESTLATTKKKKEKREIQATITQRETEQKSLAMRSAFYAEAAQQIAAVESQLLTLEAGSPLPSEAQLTVAQNLRTEAAEATETARLAMEQALAIKKRKEREPAVAKAEVLQAEAGLLRERADLEEDLADQMAAIEQEAIETNYIVLPAYEIALPATRKTLNPNEQADIEQTEEFQYYSGEKRRADSILQMATQLEAQEQQLNAEAQSIMLRSATAPIEAPDGQDKLTLADEAYRQFDKADSLSKAVARLKRQATYVENEANRALLTLPQEAYMNVIAYYNTESTGYTPPVAEADPTVEQEVATTENPVVEDNGQVSSNEDEATETSTTAQNEDPFALDAPIETTNNERIQVQEDVLTNTIFELDVAAPSSEYNDQNPIPIDPPMPSGLMYKVQIGAFRQAIRQDIFKGIAPIMGERTASGFTRYTAGEFNNFASADNAKNRIQSLGYSDAFVVAFMNGKRVSVTQARAIERGEDVQIAQATTTTNNRPANRLTQTNRFIKQGPIEVRSVENIGGSFYTVQVGVFSKPVTSAEIFSITPLQQENMANGLYRYTTGKFDNLNDANQAKDEARAIGVVDAFVTAYRNGSRVTVASISGEPENIGTATTPDPTPAAPANNQRYRIRLGVFTDRVPVAVASKILTLSSEGIDKEDNGDGTKSYYYGDFASEEEANARAAALRSEGVSDATVMER